MVVSGSHADLLASEAANAYHLCGDDLDGPCEHVRNLLRPAVVEPVPQRCASFLVGLAKAVYKCPSSAFCLRRLIQVFSHELDLKFASSGSDSALRQESLYGPRRQLRVDEDLRRHVTQNVIQKRQAQSGAIVARVVGLHDNLFRTSCAKEMGSYQHASWRTFSALSGVFGIAEDATRLGQPAEETVCYELLHPSSGTAVVLPNQV
jgi:hypothetical protein